MKVNNCTILNVSIHSISKNDLIKNISGVIFTPNVDHLMRMQKDKDFYEIYTQADWRICDSRILWFLSKFYKIKIEESIPGVDLFYDFCKSLTSVNKNKYEIFILGGSNQESLENAVFKLNLISNKKIVGSYCPPFCFEYDDDEISKIIEKIKVSRANVLAVAVGSPKQEKFIFKIKGDLQNIKVFFAIGGAIDFISGKSKRASKLVNKLGLEWAHRIIFDSKRTRLIKRVFIDNMPIFLLIIRQKMNLYKNPFRKQF